MLLTDVVMPELACAHSAILIMAVSPFIVEGRSSKQVADALRISVKTADTHRANLMRKLEIHSVSELVRYAIREKIAAP